MTPPGPVPPGFCATSHEYAASALVSTTHQSVRTTRVVTEVRMPGAVIVGGVPLGAVADLVAPGGGTNSANSSAASRFATSTGSVIEDGLEDGVEDCVWAIGGASVFPAEHAPTRSIVAIKTAAIK